MSELVPVEICDEAKEVPPVAQRLVLKANKRRHFQHQSHLYRYENGAFCFVQNGVAASIGVNPGFYRKYFEYECTIKSKTNKSGLTPLTTRDFIANAHISIPDLQNVQRIVPQQVITFQWQHFVNDRLQRTPCSVDPIACPPYEAYEADNVSFRSSNDLVLLRAQNNVFSTVFVPTSRKFIRCGLIGYSTQPDLGPKPDEKSTLQRYFRWRGEWEDKLDEIVATETRNMQNHVILSCGRRVERPLAKILNTGKIKSIDTAFPSHHKVGLTTFDIQTAFGYCGKPYVPCPVTDCKPNLMAGVLGTFGGISFVEFTAMHTEADGLCRGSIGISVKNRCFVFAYVKIFPRVLDLLGIKKKKKWYRQNNPVIKCLRLYFVSVRLIICDPVLDMSRAGTGYQLCERFFRRLDKKKRKAQEKGRKRKLENPENPPLKKRKKEKKKTKQPESESTSDESWHP